MKDEQIKQEELKEAALEDEELEGVAGGDGYPAMDPTLGQIDIEEPSTEMNIKGDLKKPIYSDRPVY